MSRDPNFRAVSFPSNYHLKHVTIHRRVVEEDYKLDWFNGAFLQRAWPVVHSYPKPFMLEHVIVHDRANLSRSSEGGFA